MRGLVGKLALLVLAVGLTLVLAEGGLRLLSPGYSPLFLDIFQTDSHGLIRLQPGTQRRYVTAEWRITVAANAEGLRDRDVPVADSGGTVLGVGDSFAFGWGVEFEEGYLTLAEEALRSGAVRIVKAGMPGAGPLDYAQFLDAYGDAYTPGAVVVSVFVGNDFADVQMGGFAGQFTVRGGLIVKATIEDEETRRPPLLRRMTGYLKSHSLLAQQAAQALWLFEQTFQAPQERVNPGLNAGDRWLWEFAKVHLRQSPPETERAFGLTTAALDRMADWCDARGVRLVLVIIPRSMQVYDWELTRWREAYRLTPDDLDLDRPQRVLTEWAELRAVPTLDLLPVFRDHARSSPGERLYFYPNAHMNAAGHALTGRLLAPFLARAIPAPH